MANINYFSVEIFYNIEKELNDIERQAMKSSLKKRIYYLKNPLSFKKMQSYEKRKNFWVRKTYEKCEQFGTSYTLFPDLKEDWKCFFFFDIFA